MTPELILTIALVVSNGAWMTFWIFSQMQSLGAYQALMGLRPQPAPKQLFFPSGVEASLPVSDQNNRIFTNGSKLSRTSPDSDMGKVTD